MFANFLLIVHLIIAIAIIILVLLQQGKGADMGAAFGGGSSQSLFGARGSANLLSRLTAALVVMFFATSLTLGYKYAKQNKMPSVIEGSQLEQSIPDSNQNANEQSDIPTTPGIKIPTEEAPPSISEIEKDNLTSPE